MKHYVLKSFSLIIIHFIFVLLNLPSYSQNGGTAAPFLNIPPSAVTLSMGHCGVAYSAGDAFSIRDNPAHLGNLGRDYEIVISSYPAATNITPSFIGNIGFINHAFAVGYNFGRDSSSIPLSIGAAYMYQNVELGNFYKTLADGTVLGKYYSYEGADNFSIGASLDKGVKLAIGLTYKYVKSNTSPVITLDSTGFNEDVEASAFDFGLLAIYPLIGKMELNEDYNLDLDASAGFSVSNIGEDMKFKSGSHHLPTRSNIGFSVSSCLNYKMINSYLKFLRLDLTCEAENLLEISTIRPNSESYRFGVSLTVLEILHLMLGSNSDSEDYWGDSYGGGIQLKGFFRLFSDLDNNTFFGFLAEHFDLTLYYAKYEEPSQRSSDDRFDRSCFHIGLSIKNILF